MHPQIVREGPGSCPICGMALEPMTPTGAEGENPELASMTQRFWAGVALSIPLFLIATVDELIGRPIQNLLPPGWAVWLQFLLATPVVHVGRRRFSSCPGSRSAVSGTVKSIIQIVAS